MILLKPNLILLIILFITPLLTYALWPIPQIWLKGGQVLKIYPSLSIEFKFLDELNHQNENLQQTIQFTKNRFKDFIDENFISPNVKFDVTDDLKTLKNLIIEIESNDDELSLETNESYELSIPSSSSSSSSSHLTAYIKAKNIYGAMHALTTFSQLIYSVKNNDENNSIAYIPFAPHEIKDYPKYKHRGLLLDTSRNYYPVKDILKIIDTMSWNKFNVFHWHIVDSPSWPYVSEEFPELSEKGAYDSKTMIYTNQDIKSIINFGQKRGVRIIPEFDMPGHTFAISYSKPELIVCPNKQPDWNLYSASPPSGQLNPILPETYQFVEKLLTEITSLFTDKFYHTGGDEINIYCWTSDESINDYINNNPGTTGNTLIENFYNESHNVVRKQGKTPMIWEEAIINHGLKLPYDVVVQVWTSAENVKKVVGQGYRVVTGSSDYWYLDCGHGAWVGNNPNGNSWCDPYKTWQKIYTYNPIQELTPEESKLVIGGEVLLWSEQSDSVNYETYLWPRSSSAAEVLWSGNFDINGQARDLKDALPRLNDWRFRMVLRGTNADPLQPLWCARTNQCNLPP